ncbi:MAG: beta-hydroxyacyl-ACP dehydratase [Phycisphaerales bacterium]|nr:beta-hydroxyacyl-ACP dehydratase [Phycisphaerales bacterium]
MPPIPIIDPNSLDCDRVLYTKEQIYDILPQKFEFAQLDGIIHGDTEAAVFAAYRDIHADEWWCRGHMPQQPIFPGVLMVECAAQLSAFAQQILVPEAEGVMGFGGVDKGKFRDSIYPPARLIFVGRAIDLRMRKFRCEVQAFANGRMAFEAEIAGIRLKMESATT